MLIYATGSAGSRRPGRSGSHELFVSQESESKRLWSVYQFWHWMVKYSWSRDWLKSNKMLNPPVFYFSKGDTERKVLFMCFHTLICNGLCVSSNCTHLIGEISENSVVPGGPTWVTIVHYTTLPLTTVTTSPLATVATTIMTANEGHNDHRH